MIAIGLTGGIGSGKSTVARMLEERGAVLVDADQLARKAVAPGTRALGAIRARFGEGVVRADGELDREALAEVVFSDAKARADLDAIVHPEVAAAILARLEEEAGGEAIVFVDVPLLAETGRERYPLAGVLVVDAPPEIVVDRLRRQRRMTEQQARARIAAQAKRAERLAIADFVILNVGTLEELSAMVDKAWEWARALAGEAPQPGG